VGLALSAIGVMVLNGGEKVVRTADDLRNLRSTEPVLAVVPADRASQAPLADRQPPAGRVLDAYDALRSAVQRIVLQRDAHVIQVCSPNEGDGATSTAVYLAVMLSQAGANVALVDLDLHKPTVHTMLGLDQEPGVTDALDEDRDDTDGIRALSRLDILDRDPSGAIVRPTFDDLDRVVESDDALGLLVLEPAPMFLPIAYYDELTVMTAGTPPRSALEVLSRRRLDELIDDLRQRYDIVIIDSPPVVAGGDAVAIARQADGAIMVVKAGSVTLPAVRRALGTVDRGGARILGVVLTGA
jgi:receptor protein-tyrosine kinase